ncbi:MAG: PfkB family carbohydrate kinase [Candidatus Omnitrophota bacterium]
MPLAVIGTVAVDSVETPYGNRGAVMGGSASYFSYAASFFTPVALVAVVGDDFPEEYRKVLKERPIDLGHLKTVRGKTFHWKGKYENDMNSAITLETHLNALLDFDPEWNLPKPPEFLFLANIDPTLQAKVLDRFRSEKPRYVACDTMNFWIQSKKKDLLEILKRVDCLILNDGEARALTGLSNLVQAAETIQRMGPRHLVIKKGEHGVLLFYGRDQAAMPALPLKKVFDPTGAGDTFAGGMIGYLASRKKVDFQNFKKAAAYGTVMASFTVQDFGLENLRRIRARDLKVRLEVFRNLGKF